MFVRSLANGGRKRLKWVSLILEAEICRVSGRNILLVCDKPTASELCRKSCIIENDRSVWRHLVRPMVPWSGHFGHFVSRHQKCARRNVPSTIWSKFRYIATGIILTSKPKWNFCLMSYGLASWRIPCSYRWDGSEIATVLNEFNQSSERKQNLICRRLFTASKKKKISHQEILCLKPGFHIIATIAVNAVIAEKKKKVQRS